MGGLYYYGFDSLYLYLVVPAIIIALWSQIKVKTTFSKYSAYRTDINGADAARRVLELNGVYGVKIERVSGKLTDHYDPRTNTIRLSESVCGSYSVSAVGVAAHEAGHAVQYAKGYFPIKLRSVILPFCNLGSQLSLPLLIIGLIFNFYFLVKLGVIFFCGALIFQLITLPVEFNASRRAVNALRDGAVLLTDNDIKYTKRVLSAAAMTYVAAALVSLAQLIRLIAITGRKR
ncbi:MAG: zinc metallopeptidase [Acutalibacteraceae bacterium]